MATANQIAFWNLQEVKRSNLAKEVETNRANVAREAETHRSNVAGEQHAINVLGETNRHNLRTEQLSEVSNLNQAKHNASMLSETRRSNLAKEAETNRHNLATEENAAAQIMEQIRANNLLDARAQEELRVKLQQYELAVRSQDHKEAMDVSTEIRNWLNTVFGIAKGTVDTGTKVAGDLSSVLSLLAVLGI